MQLSRRDERPIDATCTCYTCRTFTRAYLRHLIVAKELLAGTLLSIHNLHALIQLVKDIRSAILEGTFENRVRWLAGPMAWECGKGGEWVMGNGISDQRGEKTVPNRIYAIS